MVTRETKPAQKGIEGVNKKNARSIWMVSGLLVIMIGALGVAFYFYGQLNDLRANPQRVAEEETQALVERVSKLIVLPEDEQPTVAIVADPEALSNQPFFANAKEGDRVLIYTNARKVILYDPVSDKIVEVAPLNIGSQTAGATTSDLEEEEEE